MQTEYILMKSNFQKLKYQLVRVLNCKLFWLLKGTSITISNSKFPWLLITQNKKQQQKGKCTTYICFLG